jgi:hypothetical protein
MNTEKPIHTLIPLTDFKSILGIDDREDKLSTFCLITATYTIEHFCKRHLYRKKITEHLSFTGEYLFTLQEYPVRKIFTIHTAEQLVDPKHYYCCPDEGVYEDLPFTLLLRPPYQLSRDEKSIRVQYLAGYSTGKAPGDLASACLELAAWNMSRYRGRRIGVTGVLRGRTAGEEMERSLPENVQVLIEPYRKRTL